jgi:hypothetical protein
MQKQCSFCENDLFGVFGHDERVVTVKRIDEGNKVFREIFGGHVAEGKQLTRMCVLCTIRRYFMASCGQHRLKPLPDLESDKLDINDNSKMDKYTALLLNDEARLNGTKVGQRFCSVCPCLASHQCCTKQSKTITGIKLNPGQELEGCGLLICKSCKPHLEKNQGVLSERAFWAKLRRGEFQLRADFEFLVEGSLLHRAVWAARASQNNQDGGYGAERPGTGIRKGCRGGVEEVGGQEYEIHERGTEFEI